MVAIIEQIPLKKAKMLMVPKAMPEIIGAPGAESICYEALTVPRRLNRRFLSRCNVDIKPAETGLTTEEVKHKVFKANQEKDLFLRYAGDKPLSVVTDRFKEISPNELYEKGAKLLGTEPTVRYFKGDESLQFNFPISTRFSGLYVLIDTGEYGVYGGSGVAAVKYGIAWYNHTCSNWTIFLDKIIRDGLGRLVHKAGADLDSQLEQMLSSTNELRGAISDSREKRFKHDELSAYFGKYESRGLPKFIAAQVMEENSGGISAYSLSFRLTQLCQDETLSDRTRAKIEYLAGEVILCFDSIKQGLYEEPQRAKRSRDAAHLMRNYVEVR